MQAFLDQHKQNIVGVLTGFDRIVFRGTLRHLSYAEGMERFLGFHGVAFGRFGEFAERTTKRIRTHAREFARKHQRPYIHLASPKTSKEEQAMLIRDQDGIEEGLVCVFGCSEPCLSYEYTPNKRRSGHWLVKKQRQCLFVYFYFMDREFGLTYVWLQTWLPLDIQVGVNGREYLARRLDRAAIGYEKRDNCFTRIEDVSRAQKMLDSLLTRKWWRLLNRLARQINPHLGCGELLAGVGYYWTFRETEIATDVMFRDPRQSGSGLPVAGCGTPSSSSAVRTCCAFWAGRPTSGSRMIRPPVSRNGLRESESNIGSRRTRSRCTTNREVSCGLRQRSSTRSDFALFAKSREKGNLSLRGFPFARVSWIQQGAPKSDARLMGAIYRRSAWWVLRHPPANYWTP